MNLLKTGNDIDGIFTQLTQLIKTLRSESGCPWDRKQTLRSFHPYVLEEYHELVQAIDGVDPDEMVEEAGDLIFLVIFLGLMIEECGYGTLPEMLYGVIEKMTRRHPHVFGNVSVANDKEVIENWSKIKASEEKTKSRKSTLDGIPRSLPALSRAYQLSSRAAKVGFDWSGMKELLPKIDEEIGEFKKALEYNNPDKVRQEFGDLLFTLVNVARRLGIDPEAGLNETSDKFEKRFKYIETRLESQGKTWPQTSMTELDGYWDEAKVMEEKDPD